MWMYPDTHRLGPSSEVESVKEDKILLTVNMSKPPASIGKISQFLSYKKLYYLCETLSASDSKIFVSSHWFGKCYTWRYSFVWKKKKNPRPHHVSSISALVRTRRWQAAKLLINAEELLTVRGARLHLVPACYFLLTPTDASTIPASTSHLAAQWSSPTADLFTWLFAIRKKLKIKGHYSKIKQIDTVSAQLLWKPFSTYRRAPRSL